MFYSTKVTRPDNTTLKRTYWDVGRDRGWLFAEAEPYDPASDYKARDYIYPVSDDRSSTGWREQSALGWYLRYTDARGPNGESAYAVIPQTTDRAERTRWFHSGQEAREWIEKRTRVKPGAAREVAILVFAWGFLVGSLMLRWMARR